MLLKTFAIGAIGCSALLSYAANPVVKAEAVKDAEIKLDGVLDEAVWQKSAKHANFTRWKHPELKAVEPTVFQVAASEKGLYWAFDVVDKDIVATYTKYEDPIAREDAVEIFITADDPIPDDPNVHNCRQLIFSPKGVRSDITYLSGTSDRKWNSDWKVAVKRNAKGYTAEVFVPYYALNFVNTTNKNFNFNIARENNTGTTRELTVFNPTGRFTDQKNFAVLQLPYNDFTRYHWQLNNLELKTIPAEKGTMQVLQGTITTKTAGKVTLQATARSKDKVAAFNRINLTANSDAATNFTLPLNVGASGKYSVTITGQNKNGKVFYHTKELVMEAVPFKLKVNNPVYRKSIYPDQADKVVSISVDYQSDSALLKAVKTAFTVTDASGKVIASGEKNAGSVRTFTVDGSKWLPGKYTFTVKSSGSEALKGTLQETITVVAPHKAGNTVRLGKNREMFFNGKRFFPRGFIGANNHKNVFYKEMADAGYNTVHFYTLNQRDLAGVKEILDEAHKNNLKVFFYPYFGTSIGFSGFQDRVTKPTKPYQPNLTPASWERLKVMVNAVKEHPAFLAWYLADEPKGAEFCAELRKVYSLLKELDPHHPVIHLDFTAEGCINKREGYADLHILDMYPHPLKDGGWQRSISSVLHSMKLVNETVAPYGTWFCPQAFLAGLSSGKSRSLTYREIRGMVYGTIVHGATGIVPYKIGDPAQKYYQPFRNSGIFVSPDMHLGYLKGIGPELKALEGMLLEPEKLPVSTSTHYIIAMRKKYNNKEYIVAVNSMPDTLKCTISGKDLADGTYQVVGENRTVTVKNGKFNDSFEAHTAHIYTNDMSYKSPVNIPELEAEIKKLDTEALAALANKPQPAPAAKKAVKKAKKAKKK